MKKYILVLILTINAIYYCKAQDVDLSLQSGVSIPLLDFGSKELSKGSFTLPGFMASAELKTKVFNDLGIYVQSGFQLHPIDVGILGYEKVKADPFLDDLYIRSDPFKTIEFTGGPFYNRKLTDKLNLDVKLNAGLMIASTPYQLNKPNYFVVGPAYFEITSSTDYCFTYGGGLSLEYEISSCYSIGVNSQLLMANAKFQFINGQRLREEMKNINIWNNSLCLIIKLFEL